MVLPLEESLADLPDHYIRLQVAFPVLEDYTCWFRWEEFWAD